GTEAEWRTVAARVGAIPAYLRTARANLEAGKAAGNTPHWRMVERDGLLTAEETAQYFATATPDIAEKRTASRPFSAAGGADLKWDTDAAGATHAVFDFLARDHPSSDEEMVRWYHETAMRLVDFARKNDLFEIPADYRLEVTVTPPALESSIDGAAYSPAPPF